MTLAVTTDAGRSWKVVFREPLPAPAAVPARGSWPMPVTFAGAERGFAAATVDTTSSEGARWTTRWGVVPDGVPIGLSAIGRTDALLLVRAGGPGGEHDPAPPGGYE